FGDLLSTQYDGGAERDDLGLSPVHDSREPLDLAFEITQLALTRQQRMLVTDRGAAPAAVKAAGRPEDFSTLRDVGRHNPVPAPPRFRLVEMVDDRHLAEKVIDQVRHCRADAAAYPVRAVVV